MAHGQLIVTVSNSKLFKRRHRESCILAFNIAEFLFGYHLNSSYSTDPGRFQLLYVSNIDAVRLKLLDILVKTLIFQNVWLLCFYHLVLKYWLFAIAKTTKAVLQYL